MSHFTPNPALDLVQPWNLLKAISIQTPAATCKSSHCSDDPWPRLKTNLNNPDVVRFLIVR
jgi:hypothetical protein